MESEDNTNQTPEPEKHEEASVNAKPDTGQAPANTATSTDQLLTPPDNTPLTPSSKPSRNNKPLVVLLVLVVLVVVVVGTYFATKPAKTNNSNSSSSSTTNKAVAPSQLTPAVVSITKTAFVPATIIVKVGQAVIWTNNDTANHLVASDPYPTDNTLPTFNSKQALQPNDSFSYVFNSAGTYTYHDDLNPYTLKGTVVVEN